MNNYDNDINIYSKCLKVMFFVLFGISVIDYIFVPREINEILKGSIKWIVLFVSVWAFKPLMVFISSSMEKREK